MNYENKIKKQRRQVTIINGQCQGIALNQLLAQPRKSKKVQEILLEQKEQRCKDLQWTIQEIRKDLKTFKGEVQRDLIKKIKVMREEIRVLENEMGASLYACFIQHSK